MSKAPRAEGLYTDTFQAISPGASYAYDTATGASAQGATPTAGVTIIRLFATEDCWIAFGSNPTAVAGSSMFLPAGIVEYFELSTGERIAFLAVSKAGKLYLTEGGTQ